MQGLVVNDVGLVGALYERRYGHRGVIRLDDGVGHLRAGYDRERADYPVRVLLSDFLQ